MEFTDKDGRTIYLEEVDGTIYAYHDGEEVGYIQFMLAKDGGKYQETVLAAYPEQAHIKKHYQRKKIATHIIIHAKEIYGNVVFEQDRGYGGRSDQIHYSSEGLAFKDYCEMNNITKNPSDYEEDQFIDCGYLNQEDK